MWGPMGQSKDWILQMSHTARVEELGSNPDSRMQAPTLSPCGLKKCCWDLELILNERRVWGEYPEP